MSARSRDRARKVAGFPWDDAMAFGFGVLRHSPATFWSMTPRELHRALEGVHGTLDAPLSRDVLQALMRDFPDETVTRSER